MSKVRKKKAVRKKASMRRNSHIKNYKKRGTYKKRKKPMRRKNTVNKRKGTERVRSRDRSRAGVGAAEQRLELMAAVAPLPCNANMNNLSGTPWDEISNYIILDNPYNTCLSYTDIKGMIRKQRYGDGGDKVGAPQKAELKQLKNPFTKKPFNAIEINAIVDLLKTAKWS